MPRTPREPETPSEALESPTGLLSPEDGGEGGDPLEGAAESLTPPHKTLSSLGFERNGTARRGDSLETRLELLGENFNLVFRKLEALAQDTREQGAWLGDVEEELRTTLGLLQRQVGDHDAHLERIRISLGALIELERRFREVLVHVERGRER